MASFRKHPNGTWEYRIRYKDIRTGKYKEKSKRGFKTKKEAQLAAAKIEQQIEQKTLVTDDMTYRQAFEEWWATHSKTLKPSSRYSLRSKFNRYILPLFGPIQLKDITKAYCQEVINKIADNIDTVTDYKIQANQVFRYAVRMGYLVQNPMEHTIVPEKEEKFLAEQERPRNFWTKDELQNFLYLAKKHMNAQDYMLFFLLAYTGMRKGELLALDWQDVDLEDNTIYIHQTLFYQGGKATMQKVKTYEARTIHIDISTARMMQKWRVQQREWLLSYGYTKQPQKVLTREDGRPLRLAYPNEKLENFIKKHNLHRITVHGLRHTHASLLFEAGATVKEVQARLGHRDIKTTMDIYTHVTDTVKDKTADTFARFMEL